MDLMSQEKPTGLKKFFRGLYLDAKFAIVMAIIGVRSKWREFWGENNPR